MKHYAERTLPTLEDPIRIAEIFDGDIFSLGGDFRYDAARNRSVAVESRWCTGRATEGLSFDRIVDEINAVC